MFTMELDTEYDLIILGTGFVESVLAGAVARSGMKVLHLDHNDYYGGYTSSNSLGHFEKMLQNTQEEGTPSEFTVPENFKTVPVSPNPSPKFSNVKVYSHEPKPKPKVEEKPKEEQQEEKKEGEQQEEKKEEGESATGETQTTKEENTTSEEPADPRARFGSRELLMKSSRQYSIVLLDILPRLLFSKGDMVSLLISSAVGRYLEFKCLEKSFFFASNTIQPVPCSKSDIFKSKFITNSERRMLARLMQLIQSDIEEPGKIDSNAFASFYEFVKSQNLSPNLETSVLYAISLCSSDQQSAAEKVDAAQGLKTLETYVSSASRYGNTPFLCPLYGISELPQAFCRLCAVYGGIYVLRRSAKCLLIDPDTNEFKGIICSEGLTMKAPKLVSTGSYLPSLLGNTPKITRKSRCVVITDQPIVQEDSEVQASFLILPPLSISNNPHSIHVLQFDQAVSMAPRGKYVLHFETETTETAEKDLEKAVSFLVNVPQISDAEIVPTKPYAQWIGYFNLNLFTPDSPTSDSNVYVVQEGTADNKSVDYNAFLDEAKLVFKNMFPDQEFLPRVPNPEDVIWTTGEETNEQTDANNNNTSTTDNTGEQQNVETSGEKDTQEEKKVEEKEVQEEKKDD